MQWLVFLPAAYVIGPVLGSGMTAVWAAYVAYRILQSGVFALRWRSDGWTATTV
jgi:Na+-driven multidrug efflux pump